MGSGQAELTDILYFVVDFKNKSYQLEFLKMVWMVCVLESMECKDWLLFCQKACCLQGRNVRGEELLLKHPACGEMQIVCCLP